MTLAEGRELLDWICRQLKPVKNGAVARKVPPQPILDRLNLSPDVRMQIVAGFSKRRSANEVQQKKPVCFKDGLPASLWFKGFQSEPEKHTRTTASNGESGTRVVSVVKTTVRSRPVVVSIIPDPTVISAIVVVVPITVVPGVSVTPVPVVVVTVVISVTVQPTAIGIGSVAGELIGTSDSRILRSLLNWQILSRSAGR